MYYLLFSLYLIIFWILPLWILMMGLIIILRINDPYYKQVRDNIINILENSDELDEDQLHAAKELLQNSHPINGIRHSIARMIQSKLNKNRWSKKQRNLIFYHLYKEPIPAKVIKDSGYSV